MLLLGALVFMTSFGVWGMPQMVQKFYSIKNEHQIVRAAVVTTIFAAVISFTAYYTGALSHVFFDKVPAINGKPVFDMLIPDLLSTQLPPALMALILLLVLSASMSTLAGLVLVSASAITIDLYKGHINPQVTPGRSLFIMRLFSTLFVILSYFIARNEFAVIVTLMSLSWGAVAGSFLAPFLYGLFWRRTTAAGAAVGGLTGLVLSIALFYVLGSANSPIASAIAMIVPFAIVPIVSFFTVSPDAVRISKAFDKVSV
jgi:SSS family solute:Na+ symporter